MNMDYPTDMKLRMVSECRMIHGRRVAAKLWSTLGLPEIDKTINAAPNAKAGLSAALDRFLPACTTADAGCRVQSSTLYQAFETFCRSGSYRPNQRAFSLAMKARGFRSIRSDVVWFLDLKLVISPSKTLGPSGTLILCE